MKQFQGPTPTSAFLTSTDGTVETHLGTIRESTPWSPTAEAQLVLLVVGQWFREFAGGLGFLGILGGSPK